MVLTHLEVNVANPSRPEDARPVRFVLDSGAVYSVVPRETLEALAIRPYRSRSFIFGDGSDITREEGAALFEFRGVRGVSPVLFGKPGDDTVLGRLTLESLDLFLDPYRRELLALPTR